ncbi:hypothetical protein B3286c1_2120 [Brucella vulpis]|nr:hypothetical protein BF3285c1_2121 [Brucella vulpis]CUW50915.1 hypothetical protein B3286c1_2120 [Brucella vulpis]
MRVCRTTLDQIVPEIVPLSGRDCREPIQSVIRLVVAGQHGDLCAASDGEGVQGFQPVRPVSLTPDDPHHNQLCVPRGALHIGIHRHGVRQAQKIGQTQAWHIRRKPVRLRNAGKLRIGGGKEHDLTRCLAKIDGFIAVADRSFLGKQEMHQAASFTAWAMAASSISCRPITTSRVERVSSLPYGRSK